MSSVPTAGSLKRRTSWSNMTKNDQDKAVRAQGDNNKRKKDKATCACDGQHNEKDAHRSGKVVIKSAPSKTTRITLRSANAKPADTPVRPPWNASPTTSKATSAQAKRTIRTLPRKLPVRPKLPTQEAFSSSPVRKDAHKPAFSVEARAITLHPSPDSSKLPPKDPDAAQDSNSSKPEKLVGDGHRGPQDIVDTSTGNDQPSLQRNLKFIQQFIDNTDLKALKSNAARAAIARAYEQEVRNVATASPSLIDPALDDTCFGSDATTSPQLKLLMPSPAAERRSCFLSNQGSPGWISPLVQLDQGPFDKEGPSIKWATKPKYEGTDIRSQMSDERPPNLPLLEQRTLEEEQTITQDIVHSRSGTTKYSSPLTRVLPRSKFWHDSETSNDEQPAPRWKGQTSSSIVHQAYPRRKVTPYSTFLTDARSTDVEEAVPQGRLAPSTTKTAFPSQREHWISKQRMGLESVNLGRIASQVDEQSYLVRTAPQQAKQRARLTVKSQTPLFNPFKPAWAQTAGDEVACQTDADSTEEDPIKSSKSIINGSRRLRHSQSLGNLKSVKWDPAIIACGPVTGSKEREEHSQRQRNDAPEASKTTCKKAEMDKGLEAFRKTICQWKKGDRKSIERFLEALKNLDSDEESVSTSEPVTNNAPKRTEASSKVDKRKRMNPRAPAFQGPLLQKPDFIQREVPDLISFEVTDDKNSATRDVVDVLPTPLPVFPADPRFPEALKQEPIWINTFQRNIPSAANTIPGDGFQAPSCIPEYPRQEPIWINTAPPASTINAAGVGRDDDFQEFCRVNNFVPLVPANPVSYTNLLPDLADKRYPISSGCFNTPASSIALVNEHYYQPVVNPGPVLALNESSEPLEDDFREAKTLDSAWGAQVLENFVKKYPKTGQRADPVPEKGEEAKPAEKAPRQERSKSEEKAGKDGTRDQKPRPVHQRVRPKSSDKTNGLGNQHAKSGASHEKEKSKTTDKAGGLAAQLKAAVRAHRREASRSGDKSRAEEALRTAAEIQQRLEMILLQEKEGKAVIPPAHKVKASQIQETLEIMLYKIKEKKALEGFSRNVTERTREIERSSEDDVKWYKSRSTSGASRNASETVENLS